MGYTTEFEGAVTIEPPLNEHERSFLAAFADTRRMRRSGGPLFVKGNGFAGQGDGPDRIDNYNDAPAGQPGLWCQWTPTDDGAAIEWDGGEKFYNATEWMTYLIDHLLTEKGRAFVAQHRAAADDERLDHFTFDHVVNGRIDAEGEDCDDRWTLVVTDNVVTTEG